MTTKPYPPIEPFDRGYLRVSNGNDIYWETAGNPNGKPALHLHGGPGSGLGSGGYRCRFDPAKYLIVGLDQRGCGRSRPLAIDALERLHENTTQTLIADIEAIRQHLGIEHWLVTGVSWGTTLALAYAQEHPKTVTELVLVAVTTTSRAEVEWITETVGRIFPEAWQRFAKASECRPDERIVDAYARRLATGDAQDRLRAVDDWNAWESEHISLDQGGSTTVALNDFEKRAVFATLVTHYWSNDAFLVGEREIINRLKAIESIPAVLIHGRRDISGPAITAWRLHRHWPASRLQIIETEGHGGPKSMEMMRLACDALASG